MPSILPPLSLYTMGKPLGKSCGINFIDSGVYDMGFEFIHRIGIPDGILPGCLTAPRESDGGCFMTAHFLTVPLIELTLI